MLEVKQGRQQGGDPLEKMNLVLVGMHSLPREPDKRSVRTCPLN